MTPVGGRAWEAVSRRFDAAREPPVAPSACAGFILPATGPAPPPRFFVSFFDDDPPTQQRASAPPPGVARPPRPPRGPQDPQQILARRGIAILGFVLILAAITVILQSCVSSARVGALEDYNQEVTQIGEQSESNVAEAIAALADSANLEPTEQRSTLDQLAADSRKLTDRARELSSPGGLEASTWNLATALGLRADALARIADRIATARGTSRAQAEQATAQIAGQMRAIGASDVLWQTRVTPFVLDRFKDEDMNTEPIRSSTALKDAGWESTGTVAQRIGGEAEDPRDTTEPPGPGTHGHALQGTAANGTDLNASAPTRVAVSGNTVNFEVTIANSSENDAENVSVTVSGVAQDTKKEVFEETRKVASTKKGTTVTVRIPVPKPSTNAVTVSVDVKAVPGEDNTDNNKASYRVVFGQ